MSEKLSRTHQWLLKGALMAVWPVLTGVVVILVAAGMVAAFAVIPFGTIKEFKFRWAGESWGSGDGHE